MTVLAQQRAPLVTSLPGPLGLVDSRSSSGGVLSSSWAHKPSRHVLTGGHDNLAWSSSLKIELSDGDLSLCNRLVEFKDRVLSPGKHPTPSREMGQGTYVQVYIQVPTEGITDGTGNQPCPSLLSPFRG